MAASISSITIVGAGRVGSALARALSDAGVAVGPIVRRGELIPTGAPVLFCVPDRAIAEAAAELDSSVIAGHCSASVPLDALGDRERFNVHPFLPVPGVGTDFTGAVCAIDASTPAGHAIGLGIARATGMRPVSVPASKRALYHAAGSMASNYLMTLEWAAEQMANVCGLTRGDMRSMVNAAVDAWATRGFRDAIVGPVARGDETTVQRQRDAVAAMTPELLTLFDALTAATRHALEITAPK